MTEAEVIGSVTDLAEIATIFVSLWLSVTFAYLTVAYFLSKALSRFQYLAVSALYGFTSIWFILCAWIYTEMAILIARREEEINIFDQLPADLVALPWPETLSALLLGGTLLSYYFMYNARQTGTA
ncbi:MAG: hypothetical protein ACI9BW_002821 [Gammaproteobacteria bacterium]|jgi:hypothetical protein